ncbi:MAG: hypothetical protein ABSC22_01755 [Roseiarcus sp.]|jgi:hypothetical protein
MRALDRPLAALALLAAVCAASTAFAETPLDELRRAFTLQGKPIPPEVFRDLGAGDLGDSGPILVTVDAQAAIGSELYGDPIKQDHGWIAQTRAAPGSLNGAEETAYEFRGRTSNGLLVVLVSYSGGGSGVFYSLDILNASADRAFAADGKVYQRIDMTVLRSVPLGDRWEGDITISGDIVHIATTKTPAEHVPKQIEAKRP